MPAILSTQHIDWDMTAGVDSDITVGVSSMATERTIGILDVNEYANNNGSRTRHLGVMLSDTTYRVKRNSNVGSTSGTLDLIEFELADAPEVWHYQEDGALSGTTDEVTITDVGDISRCTAHMVGCKQSSAAVDDNTLLGIRFKSGTTDTLEILSQAVNGVAEYGIMVVKWPTSCTVKYVETAFGAAVNSFTQTIPDSFNAPTDRTLLFTSFIQATATDGYGQDNVGWRPRQTDENTISWDKAIASPTASSGTAYTFTVTCKQFKVQQADLTIADSSASGTEEITEVGSLTEAAVFATGMHSMCGKNASTGNAAGQINFQAEFLDSDTITCKQASGYTSGVRDLRMLVFETAKWATFGSLASSGAGR